MNALRFFWAYHVRYRAHRWREKIVMTIVWHLPPEIVMWCGVRMTAHATTGEFGTTHPDDVNYSVMMQRWNDLRGGDRRWA